MNRLIDARRSLLALILSLMLIISGCGSKPTPMLSRTETLSQPTQVPPTPTLTPEPPKVLNVCLAEDPGSLFRFEGRNSLAKQSVFSTLYDPAALFETLPSYTNNQAVKLTVNVSPGMNILDSSGEVTVLKEGSLIHPVVDGHLIEPAVWSASAPLQMMKVRADYNIAPGLMWSDGSSVTSADFILAFEVAKELRNPQDTWLLDRTTSLEALDETTLMWMGIAGFVPQELFELVFPPLPAAQFSGVSLPEIGNLAEAIDIPMGWGAYRITERTPGSAIWLERNPYYSPKTAYDQVVFLVEPDLEQAISQLESGGCDVLDPSYHLEAQSRDVLTGLAESGTLVAENYELVQQLVFGIQPAAYDGGYSPWTATRQDFFGDLRTRQAVAVCLTAEPIATGVLRARLPEGFIMPEFAPWGNLEQAQALLDEIGWVRYESEPEAPRKATSVTNVLDGTVFSVSLLSGTSAMDSEVGKAVVRRLADCQIEATHQALSATELYAPGPEGPLFGRNFDLALVNWQNTPGNACDLYRSEAVPSNRNYWIGTNLAGMREVGFDAQCVAAGNAELTQSLGDRLDLIAEYLPSVPLMPRISVWIASTRVDLAGGTAFADIRLWQPVFP